jgi:hypothetical protein
MVPAPRIATLLMRLILWPHKRLNRGAYTEAIPTANRSERLGSENLGKIIHCPIIIASVYDHNLREMTVGATTVRGVADQNDWKLITAIL